MYLTSCQGIKKSFSYIEVLKNINFDIKAGERLGLVGANGCGKTTLVNILFGNLAADAGVVRYYSSKLKIGYLLQSKGYLLKQLSDEESLDFASTTPDIVNTGHYLSLTKRLGLEKVQQWEDERFLGLSGGEKTKLALAEMLTHRPDFLILDEPTNHLDFQGVEWLISELQAYRGTILIISHDRFFLDQVVTRIVEIEDGEAQSYSGNYTFYREEKARQYEIQLHQYFEQKRKEEKIEGEITRLKQWSAKAHREAGKVGKMVEARKGGKEFYRSKAKKMDTAIKSRIKRLEKMRGSGILKPKEDPTVNFLLQDADKRGRRVLEAIEISKAYGEHLLFQECSFWIQRGERVGFLGPNGCGKTTLIKSILGEVALDQGELWISPSVNIGYLSQDMNDLDPEQTVLEYLGLQSLRYIDTARKVLANLELDEIKIEKQISQLSMGERIRLKLANLILERADFLILDEPTNHLDLFSREALERSLDTFEGTMVIVSHDRYMLEKLCTHLLVFEDGMIRKIEGSLQRYQEKKENNTNRELEKIKEELMVIETRITVVLGSLNRYAVSDPKYLELDQEFHNLVRVKRDLCQQLQM